MSSVWTSQYPDRHHSEVSFSARLPKDRLTLAELLSAQGIHTAGFVANAVAGAGFGFDRGFVEFHEVFRTLGSRGDVFRQALPPWLAANRDRRFFAYVHFREPHFPYDPEPPFDTKFGPDGPIPKAARRDAAWFTDVNQGRRPFGEAEREHLVRLFDGNLAFADQEVGALRQAMEERGPLGEDGRDRRRRPRRGALRARLDRPQRPPLRAERARPAHRALPEGDRAGGRSVSPLWPTSSTWPRRSPTSSAARGRAARTGSSRDAASCP